MHAIVTPLRSAALLASSVVIVAAGFAVPATAETSPPEITPNCNVSVDENSSSSGFEASVVVSSDGTHPQEGDVRLEDQGGNLYQRTLTDNPTQNEGTTIIPIPVFDIIEALYLGFGNYAPTTCSVVIVYEDPLAQ